MKTCRYCSAYLQPNFLKTRLLKLDEFWGDAKDIFKSF